MSYARFSEKSEFYAFTDSSSYKLRIYFADDIGGGVIELTKEQARELKEICEKYIKEN